jgi:putative lipoprotein (rSAM/lipoprotein system)
MPDDYRYAMIGKVVSESVEEPIPDIKVIAERNGVMVDEIVSTDTEGYFTLNIDMMQLDSVNIHLKDEDGENNGLYADLDTVLSVEAAMEHLNVLKMKEKSAK